ncbi:MAG: hypothetical protein ACQET6_18740 [Bacillota bacterium]|uniref:hypothetical protein n=1 Tax=Rossellomorea sp. FM04394 TaxID=3243076 RepID=UPI0035A6FA10
MILLISLCSSIFYVVKKRKAAGITGFKTALPSICFFMIAIMNLLAHWLGFRGIISWFLTIVFLFVGAYFTKYMVPYRTGN